MESAKYKRLSTLIYEGIQSGRYPVGTVIPSEQELQSLYGMSRGTVRKAVEQLVNDGYLKKSRGNGHGTMVLDRREKSWKIRKTLNFGTIGSDAVFDSNRHDAPAVSKGIISALSQENASLSIFPFLSEQHPEALDYVKDIISRNIVDGLFIWFNKPDNEEVCRYLHRIRFPFVYLSTHYSPYTLSLPKEYPVAAIEELQVLRSSLKKYQASGITQVILLASVEDYQNDRTHQLLLNVCGEIGIEYHDRNMQGFSFRQIAEALDRDFSRNTLIVVSNRLADRVCDAISAQEIPCPKFKLLLFKHYSPDWSQWKGKYRIFDRPFEQLGRQAASLMLDLIHRRECGLTPCNGQRICLNAFISETDEYA